MNEIHPTAKIAEGVTMGDYNHIGANVVIQGWKGQPANIHIGDCNIIEDNTRIFGSVTMGDWNVLHNNMFVMGRGAGVAMGHNCWFGQGTILDGTGGLTIANGVGVGMNSQLWTHAARGELLEGCTLSTERPTTIDDDVWLVGSCIVGSGLRLARRSICLIGSVLTHDTEAECTYGGVPAKLLPIWYWREIGIDEKLIMMYDWAAEFVREREDILMFRYSTWFAMRRDKDVIAVGYRIPNLKTPMTRFNLADKTYTKRLTPFEREFYAFLYGHKARFIPL